MFISVVIFVNKDVCNTNGNENILQHKMNPSIFNKCIVNSTNTLNIDNHFIRQRYVDAVNPSIFETRMAFDTALSSYLLCFEQPDSGDNLN